MEALFSYARKAWIYSERLAASRYVDYKTLPPERTISQGSLFSMSPVAAKKVQAFNDPNVLTTQTKKSEAASAKETSTQELSEKTIEGEKINLDLNACSTIFEAVLPVLCQSLHEPATAKELARRLDVGQRQMQKWLDRALSENVLKKEKERYHLIRQDK